MFQGLPYIIWQAPALRSTIYNFLGVSGLENSLASIVDYCQWLSQCSNEEKPELTNLVMLIWVFVKLYHAGKLTQAAFSGEYRWTGLNDELICFIDFFPALFSAEQDESGKQSDYVVISWYSVVIIIRICTVLVESVPVPCVWTNFKFNAAKQALEFSVSSKRLICPS